MHVILYPIQTMATQTMDRIVPKLMKLIQTVATLAKALTKALAKLSRGKISPNAQQLGKGKYRWSTAKVRRIGRQNPQLFLPNQKDLLEAKVPEKLREIFDNAGIDDGDGPLPTEEEFAVVKEKMEKGANIVVVNDRTNLIGAYENIFALFEGLDVQFKKELRLCVVGNAKPRETFEAICRAWDDGLDVTKVKVYVRTKKEYESFKDSKYFSDGGIMMSKSLPPGDAAKPSSIAKDDKLLLKAAGYALVKEEGSVNAASGRAPSAPPAEPVSVTPVEVPAESNVRTRFLAGLSRIFSRTAECLLFNKGPVVFKMEDEESLQIDFGDGRKHTFRAESYGMSSNHDGIFQLVDTPVAVEFFSSVFVKADARTDTGTALANIRSLENIRFASARSVGRWWRENRSTYGETMKQYDLLYFYFEQCAGRGGRRPVGIPPPPGDLRNFRIIWKEVFTKRGVAIKEFS